MFSSGEILYLSRHLSQIDSESGATSNFVKLGITVNSQLNTESWIIDFDTNRHMTGFCNNLLNYAPC